MKKVKKKEGGFTVLELLTVITTIGVLSTLSITSFYLYRKDGFYSVTESTLRNAKSAFEIGISGSDPSPSSVGLTTQNSRGEISDPTLKTILPGMTLPGNVELQASYNDSCTDSSCDAQYLYVNHCKGKVGASWIRFGDGVDITMEDIPTAGCP
jgi:Tfp pilus assembly protein PilE